MDVAFIAATSVKVGPKDGKQGARLLPIKNNILDDPIHTSQKMHTRVTESTLAEIGEAGKGERSHRYKETYGSHRHVDCSAFGAFMSINKYQTEFHTLKCFVYCIPVSFQQNCLITLCTKARRTPALPASDCAPSKGGGNRTLVLPALTARPALPGVL